MMRGRPTCNSESPATSSCHNTHHSHPASAAKLMHAWLPDPRRLFGFLFVIWGQVSSLIARIVKQRPAGERAMPPTLLIIRHAEALHNANKSLVHLRDPELSDLGKTQSVQLRDHLKKFLSDNAKDKAVGLIISSPMRRALQTALISLDWLIEAGVKVAPDARWQENSAKNWNTGSPIPDLAKEFPTIDFSSLDPIYPDKTSPAGGLYHFTQSAILNRAQSALRDLYARPEKLIIVVSHDGFLKAGVTGRVWANGDYRVFEFSERATDEEPYRLNEWEATANGGAMGLSPGTMVELGEGLPEV